MHIVHIWQMKLDTYLTERNLTDAAFGRLIGVANTTVMRLRRGETRPSSTTIAAIKEATGGYVTAADFYSDDSDRLPTAADFDHVQIRSLAEDLAKLTREDIAETVTRALRERLTREQTRTNAPAEYRARVEAAAARLRQSYDTSPVSKAEWDALVGDAPGPLP